MRCLWVGLAGAASSVLVGSCGGDDASSADAPAVSLVEETVEVDAVDNTFRPEEITVAAGTEVVWTNRGRSDHNVLPTDGDDWGVEDDEFGPDATYSYRFTEPGTYRYHCSLHGTETAGMIGVIEVTA